MGGVTEVWSKYGTQTLVLLSLVLQLLLFIIPIARRHKLLEKKRRLGSLNKFFLWLAYQLADTTAIYVLGHMAICGSATSEHRQLMALWAAVLLVHLGGQDTITAYALEDNRLWERHLLTLAVQAAGVVYVIVVAARGGGARLCAAAALMSIVGLLKFVERIYVLKSSGMTKLVDLCEELNSNVLDDDLVSRRLGGTYTGPASASAEEDLVEQAHGLLFFSLGQLTDQRDTYLPRYHKSIVRLYDGEDKLYELVELQLSLMHDMLYTKAPAIHTWHGCLIRVFSWLASAVTCMLLSTSTGGEQLIDVAATYALLAGAFLLETASLLKAAGSTWTCQILQSKGWGGLRRKILSFRRLLKAAECSRRWPGYVEQQRLLWSVWPELNEITPRAKKLVLVQIRKIVDECRRNPKNNNSRGELSLPRLSLPDDLKETITRNEFDVNVVIWSYVAKQFLLPHICGIQFSPAIEENSKLLLRLGYAIILLSDYMMHLFQERPHMLPSPVRHSHNPDTHLLTGSDHASDGRQIWEELNKGEGLTVEKLEAMLGVWVEMLCYAASNCSRESHARELSNGSGEFATVVWLLRAVLFHSRDGRRLRRHRIQL